MSPRQADPGLGARLVEEAAGILAEEGPQALTTRRLAAAVGTSTTAVYTHFGSMDDLVRAIVREGFARLDQRMGEVTATGDPVADVAALGLAYRGNALDHHYLYGVMFGGSGPGGFSLTDEDRQHGRYTLEPLVRAITAAMEAGRFRAGDARLVAHQMWIALHGLVTLELGGFLVPPYDAEHCFAAQVHGLLVGAGAAPEAARSALERAGVPSPVG
ncbi:TetR/AcrR family transcriptional regulator [Streptomyces sp. NPDC088674]|uniref:TetR/AcrR family transcriptional regulator n=1 Tax=Streptomyces sp. NPDC088674 TaxID=3365869 RepID=UPI003818EA66